MRTTKALLALIAGTFLFGCGKPDYSGIPVTHVVVTVSCSNPGMRFTGTIVSDGRSEKLSGTGSGTYDATGHEMICYFKKTDIDGQISMSVSNAGRLVGRSSTPTRYGGVRAELLLIDTPSRQHILFTTF
jgi:hypothetical protein